MKYVAGTFLLISVIAYVFGGESSTTLITSVEEIVIHKDLEVDYENFITPEEFQRLRDKNYDPTTLLLALGCQFTPMVALSLSMATCGTGGSFKDTLSPVLKTALGVSNLFMSFKDASNFVVHSSAKFKNKSGINENRRYSVTNLIEYTAPNLAESDPFEAFKVHTRMPGKVFSPLNTAFGVGSLWFANSILDVEGRDMNMYYYTMSYLPLLIWGTVDLQGFVSNMLHTEKPVEILDVKVKPVVVKLPAKDIPEKKYYVLNSKTLTYPIRLRPGNVGYIYWFRNVMPYVLHNPKRPPMIASSFYFSSGSNFRFWKVHSSALDLSIKAGILDAECSLSQSRGVDKGALFQDGLPETASLIKEERLSRYIVYIKYYNSFIS